MTVFSRLTKAQRDKLPASAFGDPKNRLFPVVDQDDVDSAARLIGKADNPAAVKRRIIAIARRKGLKIPDAWQAATHSASTGGGADLPDGITLAVPFSVESEEEDGDDVVLKGRFFRAGDYPDKDFSLTPDELYAAIAAFYEPVPVDLEHRPLVFGQADLSGAFGRIDTIWSDDGEWMMAEARKPRWLHQVMPETRISATFSRETKEVIGAAWTATPRVTDAQLVAAFARARHDTPSGQMAMQRVHDASVAGGAVCAPPEGGGSGSGQAKMASRHEAKAIQQVHDVAVEHGASCEANGRSPGAMAGYFSDPPAPTRGKAAKVGRRRMNVLDWIKGKAEEEGVSLDDKELTAAFNAPSKAELEAAAKKHEEALQALHEQHQREMDAIRKQQEATAATFAAQATERRELEAAQFAERQVAAKKVPPAARAALAALAARVSHGDAAATFSEGEKSTRALLDEFLSKLPDFSVFTTASIDPAQVAALFNESGADEKTGLSDERRKHLLGATPLGRSIDRDKSASN